MYSINFHQRDITKYITNISLSDAITVNISLLRLFRDNCCRYPQKNFHLVKSPGRNSFVSSLYVNRTACVINIPGRIFELFSYIWSEMCLVRQDRLYSASRHFLPSSLLLRTVYKYFSRACAFTKLRFDRARFSSPLNATLSKVNSPLKGSLQPKMQNE